MILYEQRPPKSTHHLQFTIYIFSFVLHSVFFLRIEEGYSIITNKHGGLPSIRNTEMQNGEKNSMHLISSLCFRIVAAC